MRKALKGIGILALCLMVLTGLSLEPAAVFAAGSTGGATAVKTEKKAKKPKSEEEVAARRASNTGVSEGKQDKDSVTAEQSKRNQQEDTKNVTVSTYETSASDVDIEARGAVIFCSDTGEVLYGKNRDKHYDPLSMTKVMTALLVMKRAEAGTLSLEDYATCTKEDAKVVEMKMYISKGEKMQIRDLLYGALLESDNDAAAMLGSHIGGDKAGFAALMNEQAGWLGCTNTKFTNANGLIEGDLHSSPYDMALIGREAFKYQELREICQTRKHRMPAIKLRPNGWTAELTNPFFKPHRKDKAPYKTYQIQGGKTGTWDYSNSSLMEVANINGREVITVVMKTPLDKRYSDTRKLLNYARSVFKERDAIEKAIAERAERIRQRKAAAAGNEYLREANKLPFVKRFFKFVNKTFRDSCMEIDVAYKTKSDDVALSWEKRPAADGYLIYRAVDGGDYEKIGNTESGDVTKFRDETVEKKHVYRYFVRAYRGDSRMPCT